MASTVILLFAFVSIINSLFIEIFGFRSFQLKAESVIETSKPFLLHGLYYIVYVILDSTKTHDSVLEVYEKNPENYQCMYEH